MDSFGLLASKSCKCASLIAKNNRKLTSEAEITYCHVLNRGASSRHGAQGLKKELPVKLLDEMLVFSNSVMQFLNEQSDFLVVGCIGTQGVGKSHILSSLFQHDRKRKDEDLRLAKSYGYLPNIWSHEDIENSNHKTSGIDAYITPERVILLDCQPVLSCSVMYSDIQAEWEKKIGFEFGSTEAGAEMNSIQLISFLLSVCHVLLVVQDWTVDLNLLRLIQTAEMLKPSFPPLNQDEPYVEAFPHLAFIFNRASDDDSRTDRRLKLSAMLRSVFSKSNLKVESGISNVQDPPHLPINLSFFGEESQNETEVDLINLEELKEFFRLVLLFDLVRKFNRNMEGQLLSSLEVVDIFKEKGWPKNCAMWHSVFNWNMLIRSFNCNGLTS
nr:EOG090X0EPT [Artemia franciscana]